MAKHMKDTSVEREQSMPSNMESPLNAQKESPEPGPAAPKGLPDWPAKDPMGYLGEIDRTPERRKEP